MRDLRQGTAITVPIGPFVDSTDGVTLETALTLSPSDIQLSINNAALAAKNNATTATYDAGGMYRISLGSTVDVATAGPLRIIVAESGAVPVVEDFRVLPATAYDALYAGGTIGIDAAGVRAAVGLASANLDTQISTVDTVVDGITAKITGTFLMVAGGSLVIDGGGVLALEATAQSIKAKTDSLTFTVASNLNANIHYVNDVAVTGTGAAGDEWGP